MNIDNLLRDYARHDLQRLCPPAHYWLRDHDPIADRELVEPLLREPVRFGLTPREIVAATAMRDLATYTISSRAIWDAAYPARDSGDTTPTPGMTFDQEREIWARREVFRNSALVYARMLGDTQLIERYQSPEPAPAPDTATPAPVVDIASNSTTPDPERRLARLRALGGDAIYKRGEWRIPGISALVASEKSEGRKRCDEKTIRADIKEAAENEREAKRSNAFAGLGQR